MRVVGKCRRRFRPNHQGTPILKNVAEAVDAVVPTVIEQLEVFNDAATEIDVMNEAAAV